MPAFFLISGYCSNFRKDPKTFLKSLLKSLVLPLFALSLVNDTMYALMVTHQDISTTLLKTIKSGGTLWFIQALVIAKVICYSIQKVTDALIIMLIATFVLLIAGVALNQFNLRSSWPLSQRKSVDLRESIEVLFVFISFVGIDQLLAQSKYHGLSIGFTQDHTSLLNTFSLRNFVPHSNM